MYLQAHINFCVWIVMWWSCYDLLAHLFGQGWLLISVRVLHTKMVADHIGFIILKKQQGNDRFDCHSNSFCASIFVVVLFI